VIFCLLLVLGSACCGDTKHFNSVGSASFTSEHIAPADVDATTITRYVHIRHSDAPVRVFKETTV
jgi:hypothetical protein